MDEVLRQLFDRGAWGMVALYFLIKHGHIWQKKRKGTYVSYEEIRSKMNELEVRIKNHEELDLKQHAQSDGFKLGQEVTNKSIISSLERILEEMKDMRKDVSDFKNILIQRQ